MFESYYQQLGLNILSSSYNGLVSVSSKSDHLITTFAFDNYLQNPRATAVFTEKIGIFGFSNDNYETAASYTYKTVNGRFRPTISFLEKSDESQSIKVHIPYTINFNDSHSFKIFASDEISLNEANVNQASNNQSRHLLSLSGKLTHQLFNGKVTSEETLKIIPQLFFASIINYSSVVLDTYMSVPIQQIKAQYAYDNILCFTQLIRINRIRNPLKYNIGFIVTDPHTMLGFYYKQVEINNFIEEEEEEDNLENNDTQNAPAVQNDNVNVDSFDIIDVFKVKIMHKQNGIKYAAKFTFDNSLKVTPKAGIELKLNSGKVILGANGKLKEVFFKYEKPFGKNNNHICTLNASFDWVKKISNKIGISLQLNH